MSGFPNFFMLYGPNTNLGHNSILVMIEYNRSLARDLEKSVWADANNSWYKPADETITNN